MVWIDFGSSFYFFNFIMNEFAMPLKQFCRINNKDSYGRLWLIAQLHSHDVVCMEQNIEVELTDWKLVRWMGGWCWCCLRIHATRRYKLITYRILFLHLFVLLLLELLFRFVILLFSKNHTDWITKKHPKFGKRGLPWVQLQSQLSSQLHGIQDGLRVVWSNLDTITGTAK